VPYDTWQCRSPHEQGGGMRCRGTHGSVGALPSREAGSGAVGHMAAPEPSRAGRQGLEPWATWQQWSHPEQGGGIWCHGTHGSAGALPSWKAGSGVVGHMAAPEPSRAGRQDLEPWDTWQNWSPPQLRGEIWNHRTHGSTGAHLIWEARSGVVGHVAVWGCTPCDLSWFEPYM
jgi:hypothetical protein